MPPVIPAAAPPPGGAPFQWGLTPGAPVEPAPTPEPRPYLPPAQPVVPPVAPPVIPPVLPPVEPALPPADVPTVAIGVPADVPTTALAVPEDAWRVPPLDSSLEGATEVIEAELVGLADPQGEGNPTSAIDSIFGETAFRDYEGEPLIAPLPQRTVSEESGPPKGPRAPISRTQLTLLWVAIGLVAILALVALFLLGTRIAGSLGAAPAITPSPTPSPTPTSTAVAIGPIAPGEYQWDELLGGECLGAFESAWQDRYTVVDCATPHPAQMVYRGVFADEAAAAYPGIEELQKRINLLCTAPTIIDYAAAGAVQDIQVAASFAVDEADWNAGNRTYFCFANRAGGEPLTVSIAVPQAAPPAP